MQTLKVQYKFPFLYKSYSLTKISNSKTLQIQGRKSLIYNNNIL